MFDTFSIKRIADGSEADIMEVDKMLREHFNLQTNERDLPYGHFYFTDRPMGSQESISWAGLIHCVIYYSEINGGRKSTYDMVAALTWIKWAGILFPDSSVDFLSKMMGYLEQMGYYVYVERRIQYDMDTIMRCIYEEVGRSHRSDVDFLMKVIDHMEFMGHYHVLDELEELRMNRE